MEEKKKKVISVKIITEASIEVKGENENEIMEKFIGDVNSYTIEMKGRLDLKTIDGKVHTFNTNDVEIEYTGIEDTLDESLKKKNTISTLSGSEELKR